MRGGSLLALCVLCTALLFGCTQKPAGVEEKGGNYYGRTSYYPTPLVKKNLTSKSVKVSKGDTVYSIAKKHHIPLRHFIDVNNLKPPYHIKAGTMLMLPTVHTHEVKYRETLFSIAQAYGVSLRQLVKANRIPAPYIVKEKQPLVIPFGYKDVDDDVSTTAVASTVHPSVKPQAVVGKKTSSHSTKLASSQRPVLKNSPVVSHSGRGFAWPLLGKIVSRFGPKKGGLYNDGINIAAKEGAPVKAANDGVVVYSGSELKGYGNLLLIKHSGGYITAYAHNKHMKVSRGQKVKQGEVIAYVGKTGHVTSPQLHFAIRKGRKAVNPQKYLQKIS